MIRAVLLLLLVVSAATLLGLAVAEHSGYVLIAWKGLRYESSLWVFLLLLALAWGLFVGVRWLVRVLLASGGVVNPWSRRNRGKRQQLAADKGLRLASNFSRFVICRDIPPGFHEVAIDTDELQKMRKEAA